MKYHELCWFAMMKHGETSAIPRNFLRDHLQKDDPTIEALQGKSSTKPDWGLQ
jgi:hypothetical protein